MITFKEITKTFREDFWKPKNYALDRLSFKLEEDKVTGFLGRNGAGKTTAIKIILGFIKQDLGSLDFSSSLGKTEEQIKKNMIYTKSYRKRLILY